MEQPAPSPNIQKICGSWKMVNNLGAGGFAHVVLFQNMETQEEIAVKLCRLELTARSKERWCREILIMKKLNHPNVVTARDVPDEMACLSLNDLPLLAMEFCSKGDLRKIMSRPENVCGLKERNVLDLLHDVGSGIQYLHANKIIHRDLKPENIVLKEVNGRLTHKIIDLGYAKDLDEGSLCTSFVGTLQYLAPELFENQPYTVTVDYWSFGTMIFECCCGFRPFLHNLQPVQWATLVKDKEPEDIMAVEEDDGEVVFSSHLPQPNYLSSVLVEPLEQVLRLMLRWNSLGRGGRVNSNTKKPHCFELLDELLSIKVMHVLNMGTGRVHSFQLSADESVDSLQTRLEAETGVAADEQEILHKVGMFLDPRKPAMHYFTEDLKGLDSNMVFLFDETVTKYTDLNMRQPSENVRFMMMEPEEQMPVVPLRKVWGEAVNYVCRLKEDYNCLFQGQRAAMLSLLHYNSNLTRYNEMLSAESYQLKAKLDFFKSCLQYDLEKYSDQMHWGIYSEKMLKAWQASDEKATTYEEVAEVSHLDEEIAALHCEIVELQRSPFARHQAEALNKLEETAKELYRALKRRCKNPGSTCDSVPMVNVITQSAQIAEQMVKDLYSHLEKILIRKEKIMEMFPRIEQVLDQIREADESVLKMQARRQNEFWFLLKLACTAYGKSATPSPNSMSPPTPLWRPSPPSQPPSGPHPLASLPSPGDSDSTAVLLQESQSRLSQLSGLMREARDDQAHSVEELDWSWTSYESSSMKQQTLQKM
ncbi:inhibitor of nuclear factor kappa-B kinase subunit alpha-like isoform X2 [Sardina pilchardus]